MIGVFQLYALNMLNEWIMSKMILSKTFLIRLDGNYINTKTLFGSVDIMSPWNPEIFNRQIPGIIHTTITTLHIVALVRPRASTLLHVGYEPSGSKLYFFIPLL